MDFTNQPLLPLKGTGHLVGGEIKLIPSDDNEYLEAKLNGHYGGLVRMAAGARREDGRRGKKSNLRPPD